MLINVFDNWILTHFFVAYHANVQVINDVSACKKQVNEPKHEHSSVVKRSIINEKPQQKNAEYLKPNNCYAQEVIENT